MATFLSSPALHPLVQKRKRTVGIIKPRRQENEEGERETANLLMRLSGDGEDRETSKPAAPPTSPSGRRVFECKSCNRQFATFQALGGHRASHKKPRVAAEREEQGGKAKAHGCSVCGLEFAVGQALGGHMRRHRAAAVEDGEKKGEGTKRAMWVDLNLTPTENDLVIRSIFGIGDWAPVVDCLQ